VVTESPVAISKAATKFTRKDVQTGRVVSVGMTQFHGDTLMPF
jgi:hypothetical protein